VASVGEQFWVAEELDGVAYALVVPEEDAAGLGFSVPCGGSYGWLEPVGELESGFIFAPAFLPLLRVEQDVGQVPVGVSVVGVDLQSFAEQGFGGFGVGGVGIGFCQIDVGGGESGVGGDEALVEGLGFCYLGLAVF